MAILQKCFATTESPPTTNSQVPDNIPELYKCSVTITDKFDITNDVFPGLPTHTYTFDVPALPQKLGLQLVDDVLTNVPFIKGCDFNSPAYHGLPPSKRRNFYIIATNNKSLITASYARSLIQNIQQSGTKQITLSLIHRGISDKSSTLEVTRAMFA